MRMQSALRAALAATLALSGLGGAASRALAAESGIKLGVLTCRENGGWGFVVGSSHGLHCTFSGGDGRRIEHYVGHFSKFGVDIGYQRSAVLVWAVFAPSENVGVGSLAGSYGGVTAGATVAVGASANALIGGSTRTLSLQPLSLGGASGLNVAAGIASMTLRYASTVVRHPYYRRR